MAKNTSQERAERTDVHTPGDSATSGPAAVWAQLRDDAGADNPAASRA